MIPDDKKRIYPKMNEQEGWAPGWDAIDDVFDNLYPRWKRRPLYDDVNQPCII